MAAREGQDPGWPLDEVEEVQELLEELPQRQGAPVMVPFGRVAFFPGHLIETEKVFAEKRLAVAAAAKAARDGGAGSGEAPGAAALEHGRRIGAGDAALLEMSPGEAATLLQQLLPPAADPQPPALPQRQPPATQRLSGPQQPAPAPALAQRAASRQVQQQAQQLSELVEGQTPEQLEALRAALQQLGASLEQQAAAAAGGKAPSTEGKEIVDIREEWSDVLHGMPAAPAAAPPRPAPGAANGSPRGLDEESASEGGDSDSELLSEDSFEALMQRMEALEMDESALAEAAAAAASAAAAAGAQPAAAQKPGGKGGGSGAGGFKKGFLLGKALEPEATGRQAGAAPSSQQLPTEAAEEAAAAGGRQRQERGEAAARRREAAFSGRVVERPGSAPAPDPSSPPAQDRATGAHSFPGFPVVERRPPPPQQQQQQEPEQQQAEAPPRLSRFKQRRAGLL